MRQAFHDVAVLQQFLAAVSNTRWITASTSASSGLVPRLRRARAGGKLRLLEVKWAKTVMLRTSTVNPRYSRVAVAVSEPTVVADCSREGHHRLLTLMLNDAQSASATSVPLSAKLTASACITPCPPETDGGEQHKEHEDRCDCLNDVICK